MTAWVLVLLMYRGLGVYAPENTVYSSKDDCYEALYHMHYDPKVIKAAYCRPG